MVGMLHFWGITVDTLSCINIVLAIGLCVDYSAHIAHAFIVSKGKNLKSIFKYCLFRGIIPSLEPQFLSIQYIF